jgi:hypothetical protein
MIIKIDGTIALHILRFIVSRLESVDRGGYCQNLSCSLPVRDIFQRLFENVGIPRESRQGIIK